MSDTIKLDIACELLRDTIKKSVPGLYEKKRAADNLTISEKKELLEKINASLRG